MVMTSGGGRACPAAVAVAALIDREHVIVAAEIRGDEIEPVSARRAAVHADHVGFAGGAEILIVQLDAGDFEIATFIRRRLRLLRRIHVRLMLLRHAFIHPFVQMRYFAPDNACDIARTVSAGTLRLQAIQYSCDRMPA